MIDKLIRPHLRSFQAYQSARSEMHEANIFLDANELSLGSPVSCDGVPLNRYPDPYQLALRTLLARRLGVPVGMVFAGVGSDEIIDLLIRLICNPGKDSIAVLEPTYGVYRVSASLNDIQVIPVELDESFQIDVPRTLASIPPATKMIFFCSPNNPTGNLLREEGILKVCSETEALVVVDEAYVEFSNRPDGMKRRVAEVENLVVLRTLSKAWGLAGIRLGYCIADPQVVSYLLKIKSPYNLNSVTLHLAECALASETFVDEASQSVTRERERVAQELQKHPLVLHVYPSDANFLLVRFRDARKAFQAFYTRGIVVRRRSEPRLADCLRITVGTPEENSLVLHALGEVTA